MPPSKPNISEDLAPPFRRIGEAEWDANLRALLGGYGVPEPAPVGEHELDAREAELGFTLDGAVRSFLRAFGPVDFRSMRVLSLQEIRPLDGVWFAVHLSVEERQRLPSMVAVLDYLGTGDFVAWDQKSGGFWLVRHDPAGIHPWLATFDDCIREQCVELAVGYYGWPEPEVEELAEAAKRELFPSAFGRDREPE